MIKFSRIEEVARSRGYYIDQDGFVCFGEKRRMNAPDKKGYRVIYLTLDNKVVHCFVHRLQAFQKYGDAIYQNGIVVRHLNGDSLDNSYNNIAIGSYKDNQHDRPREDVMKYVEKMRDALRRKNGSQHFGGNGSIISEEDKQNIRADHASGMGYKRLRKKYGYSISGIFYVCNGCKSKNTKNTMQNKQQ